MRLYRLQTMTKTCCTFNFRKNEAIEPLNISNMPCEDIDMNVFLMQKHSISGSLFVGTLEKLAVNFETYTYHISMSKDHISPLHKIQ